MKFNISDLVRVTAKKTIKSKAGNDLTFVTFANKETFEVLEAKVAFLVGQAESGIVEGQDYTAVVDFDGTYCSVTLTPAGFPTAAAPIKTPAKTSAKQ